MEVAQSKTLCNIAKINRVHLESKIDVLQSTPNELINEMKGKFKII